MSADRTNHPRLVVNVEITEYDETGEELNQMTLKQTGAGDYVTTCSNVIKAMPGASSSERRTRTPRTPKVGAPVSDS